MRPEVIAVVEEFFEAEFGGNPRLFNISGPGLPLGIKTVSVAEALTILKDGATLLNNGGEKAAAHAEPPPIPSPLRGKLHAFIRREMDALTELRETLSSGVPPEAARLDALLDYCDYLWAHFPDCAGATNRPPSTDVSFLKRVRTEIDPFLVLWEQGSGGIGKK